MRSGIDTHCTPDERRQIQRGVIESAIRQEQRMLEGWRRRYRFAGPEEREELERYAAAANESISKMEADLWHEHDQS